METAVKQTKPSNKQKQVQEDELKKGNEVLTQLLSLTAPTVKGLLSAAVLQGVTTLVEKYRPGDFVVDSVNRIIVRIKKWGRGFKKKG